MKTTLDLPDDLMREVKIRAAKEGKKLKEIFERALRNDLNSAASQPTPTRPIIVTDPIHGHLVVKSPPDAPVSKMTIEEILQLEQDALTADDLIRAGLTT